MSKEIFKPTFLITPLEVINHPNLRPLDGHIYGVIWWLVHMKEGKCYASNQYIAGVLDCNDGSVRNSVSRLVNEGFIECIYADDKKNDRTEIRLGVSSNDDRGVIKRLQGVSSNDAHKKKSIKKKSESETFQGDLVGRYKRAYTSTLKNVSTLSREYPHADITNELHKWAVWYQNKERDPGHSMQARMKSARKWLDKAKPTYEDAPQIKPNKTKRFYG